MNTNPETDASNNASLKDLRTQTAAQGELPLKEKRVAKRHPQATTIPRRRASEPAAASYAQRRLWFLDQLEPGGATYNMPYKLRLSGRLRVESLRLAFEVITQRHEVLRTTFEAREGEPLPHIHAPARWSLPVVDLSALPGPGREAEAKRLEEEEARRGFNLSRGALLRTTLVKLEESEHVLLATMHHIISDGWSMRVLMNELATHYEAHRAGRASGLPELPVQYADYAAWQQQQLQGEALERELSYWRTVLAGAPTSLELPTDRPRPAVQSYSGSRERLQIKASVEQGLRGLSLREGLTLHMLLLAAFQVLLHRYSGQEDICIGTPIAGRNKVETESLIGFFVNTIVIRTDLSGDPTFLELAGRVRELVIGALTHQDLPFEKLVEELNPERSMSHSPLFQVMFDFQNAGPGTLQLPGLSIESSDTDTATSKFDFGLDAYAGPSGLACVFEYNTELFDMPRIKRLASHFANLLEGVVADPNRRISDLPILSESEQEQLLSAWNDAGKDYDHSRCVNELFEAEVDSAPDAIAAVFNQSRITYIELDRRSNQLAHFLRRMGVGPEVMVGIYLERSLDLLVSVFGVLKAGGAYVPLDPAYPKERLAFLLEDARLTTVLTHSKLASQLHTLVQNVVSLDCDWEAISARGYERPSPAALPDNVAYVIYTSGSTGRPKGVMVSHRSLVNAFLAWEEDYRLRSDCGTHLQMASFSFDVFAGNMVRALCSGGKLVMCPGELLLEPDQLYRLMLQEKVDAAEFVPAVVRQLIDYVAEQNLSLDFMKLAVVGSDSWSVWEFEQLRSCCGESTRVINSYGVTESTIDSSYFESTSVELSKGALVPIGRPYSNTRVYILDTKLRPVPIGVAGEIFIGGVGLARGYLNRPNATAERFIPDPFSQQQGARLYRTGDRAHYLEDGTIMFLGRADDQVKIRGFRIELAEIESALSSHPYVSEAVVIALEVKSGSRMLVAYVVPGPEGDPTTSELRAFLKERLPEYMIPSSFVTLGRLPLSPNGKVDRRALPAPEATRPDLEESFIGPRNHFEEIMAGIWIEVLKIERVGMHDNFFDLGGHSLLATQVVARIRNRLAADLPLRLLFESPTVAALARQVEQASPAQAAPPIERVSRDSQLPLSFAQQRLWVLDQLDPGDASYNIAGAVRITGALNLSALDKTLKQTLSRHESLRTRFVEVEGQPLQVIDSQASLELIIIDLSAMTDDGRTIETERLAREEAQQPFDLSADRLLRARLIGLGDAEHVLLLTMHHIVSDGWSLGVLAKEVSLLYGAYVNGRETPLPDLPIQYVDYSAWQRRWLSGEVLEKQLEYWRGQLQGAAPALELPTDRLRPAVQTHRGALKTVELDAELIEGLRRLCRREGATLYMALLAAYQVLLHRYTGQEDISVGTPIAGRTRTETEGLIGLFVNTLVMRTDFSGEPTFIELLGRVKRMTLEAYANQDVPFEKLVETLSPRRDMSRAALFQVMFVLQNAPFEILELGEAKLELLTVDTGTSKFELTLSLEEVGAGISGWLEYNTDLFDEATVERMGDHYRTLVEGIVSGAEREIGLLPMLTEGERQQLLIEWNATELHVDEGACVHSLFEAQVDYTPEVVALVCGEEEVTYSELDRRANRLAHHLNRLGAGPEVLIGVCLSRSSDLVVALLAILKSGAAYLPLDPSYPADRLTYMLADSEARLVLTDRGSSQQLAATGVQRLCLDGAIEALAAESDERPARRVEAEHLAYVIYTSGSTGSPKGVAITHRSASVLLRWSREVFSADEMARVLAATSICFDLSIFEIFGPLTAGGTVVVVRDALELSDKSGRERVTLINTVPSVAAELVRMKALPETVRTVNLAGEALPHRLAQEILEMPQVERVYNLYGPTEDTTYSTSSCVEQGAPRPPTIGRPIRGTRAYVVDRRLRQVAIGVVGELYLAGEGLARGYLHRAALTAERFMPDPFSIKQGSRMYRTGDLARWLPNGELDYVGRIDHQVKVRGFRIELGEVESSLEQQAAVLQSAVVVREDATGNKRLVAYVVLREQATTGELRDELRRRLPDYMVPGVIVVLEEMPLTRNGKIDRRALPEPPLEGDAEAYVGPSTLTEELIARIWGEVLGVERVGVEDNFFELGGHSLLAVRLLARIEDAFGCRLPLSQVFRTSTVAGLAVAINDSGSATRSPLLPLRTGGARPPLFFVHAIGGSAFAYRDLAAHLGEDQPFYGLHAAGVDDDEPPCASVHEMAHSYLEAVRRIQPEGPYRLGGWSFGGLVAMEMAQKLLAHGGQVDALVLVDTWVPGTLALATDGQDEGALIEALAAELGIDVAAGEIETMQPEARIPHLAARAVLGGLFSATNAERHLSRLLRVLKAHDQAISGYTPRPYAGPFTLIRAADLLTHEAARIAEDPTCGWAAWSAGQIDVRITHGNHFSIVRPPHVSALATLLRSILSGTRAA